MYIRRLIIRHFRGFSSITVKPSGNVVLMGEPEAGRSDIINAITSVTIIGYNRMNGNFEL